VDLVVLAGVGLVQLDLPQQQMLGLMAASGQAFIPLGVLPLQRVKT
jgi:hypothetical protein